MGPQWKPNRKKTCSSRHKREQGLSFKISIRNTSAGGYKLQCNIMEPSCIQQTLRFQPKAGTISGEKPAQGKTKDPSLGSQ
jgi:hypothetical protein